jgi:hypothetical protein
MASSGTVNIPRPQFEKKLDAGAIASCAQATGTAKRTTFATSTVTLAELAGVMMALLADLKTRGIIQ